MWSQAHSNFWLQWLEKYKSLRCLWDVDCKDYNNRAKRNDAYVELLHMVKQVEKNADESYVKKRINSFRGSFRRQIRKAKEAKKNGLGYESTTYYFDLLKSFLRPYDTDDEFDFSDENSQTSECVTNSQNNNRESPAYDLEAQNTHSFNQAEVTQQTGTSFKKRRYSINSERPEINNKKTTELQDELEDEYGLFGRRLASHFRSMKPDQRLLAEKFISDVCIYARLGKLSLESDLIIDPSTDPRYI